MRFLAPLVIQKTLTSSDISTAGVDITGVSANGALIVEDIILQTDASVGLAGGTNLTVSSNNAAGQAVIMSTAVSGLGAAKTVDFANASVTKIKSVLESGKKLIAKMTGVGGTGAGTVTITVRFWQCARAASIAAA